MHLSVNLLTSFSEFSLTFATFDVREAFSYNSSSHFLDKLSFSSSWDYTNYYTRYDTGPLSEGGPCEI